MTASSEQQAEHYDNFFGPFYFEPFAAEVSKRIKVNNPVLVVELASGTGRVTRYIRSHIPSSAKLIASDIDESMLSIAKRKLDHPGIEWKIINAEQLPFDDNSVDLLVCCFAYMFISDKKKAFSEAYRVLKPGGHLLFTTWDKLENNPASYTGRKIAAAYLNRTLDDADNPATSMSDPMAIRQLLTEAGFDSVCVETVTLHSSIATAKEAAEGFVQGGIYDELDPSLIPEIKLKVENELGTQFGSAPMVAPISALISEAWK